ncbi:MAG TPA: hypothetical protein VIF37_03625 [Methylobacter sp.]|jgi:hypothetical protein
MEIHKAESIEDLKSIGTIDEIVSQINHIVAPFKLDAESYEEILKATRLLKEKWCDFKTGPFISEEEKYIFLLTEMDGEKRSEKLGLTDQHYEDKELAKRWFRSIASKIHPDKSSNKDGKAFKALKDIYDILIDYDEDVQDV